MASREAPLFEAHAPGFPRALVAGKSVVLGFFIPGDPVAKERPKARVLVPKGGGRPFPQFYTPEKTVKWEQLVAEHARAQLLAVEVEGDQDFTLPVAAEVRILANIRFNIAKPVSYPKSVKHATRKPDLDNLVKAILDGLVTGRVITDDNCVTDLMTSKRYACQDHPVGVEVELTCLPL